jgi:hypothetical protein
VLPLAEFHHQQAAQAAYDRLTFLQRLGSAFGYPLAKGGWGFLIAGTVILWVVEMLMAVVAFAPLFGFAALIMLLIFSWGWLFSYTQKIIVSTSRSEDALPEWPEITEWWDDLTLPFFACLGVFAFCFGPAILYSVVAASNDFAPTWFYPLFLLGALYLPMAVVVVALTGRLLSANPFVVLPAIAKVPRDYFLLCLILVVALGLLNGAGILIDQFAPRKDLLMLLVWSGFWGLVRGFIFIYLMVLCARAAGLLYRCNWRKFGWFKH